MTLVEGSADHGIGADAGAGMTDVDLSAEIAAIFIICPEGRLSRPTTTFFPFKSVPKAAAYLAAIIGSRPAPIIPLIPEVEIINVLSLFFKAKPQE